MRRRTCWRAVLSAACAGALVFACWAPTEVTVTIVSDIPCTSALRTGIYTGDDITTADQHGDTTACVSRPGDDSLIGSLVFVPADARDGRVVVQVVMNAKGKPIEPCRVKPVDARQPLPDGCIVARRTFRFIRHTSRPVTIRLDAACLEVACLDDETCINGRCRPSDIDKPTFDPGCRDCTAGDAGPGLVDAATKDGDAEASVDAPPPACTGPRGDGTLASQSVGSAHLALTTDSVIWVGPDLRKVHRLRKDGSGPYDTMFDASTEVSALATGGGWLWVGTASGLFKVPLVGPPPTAPALAGEIFALATDGDVVVGTYRPDPFVAEDVFKIENGTISSTAGQATSIALSPPWVYGGDDRVGMMRRFQASPLTPGSGFPLPGLAFVAALPAGAAVASFFDGTTGGLRRMSATISPSTPWVAATNPGKLAVRGDGVYVVEGATGSRHVSFIYGGAPAGGFLQRIEPADYPTITSLAVDDCVYFFTEGPGQGTLRVRPKLAGAP